MAEMVCNEARKWLRRGGVYPIYRTQYLTEWQDDDQDKVGAEACCKQCGFIVNEYEGINKLSWGFIVSLKRHYSILSIVRRALSHRPTIACSSSEDQQRQGDKPFSVQLQISSVHCLWIELTSLDTTSRCSGLTQKVCGGGKFCGRSNRSLSVVWSFCQPDSHVRALQCSTTSVVGNWDSKSLGYHQNSGC